MKTRKSVLTLGLAVFAVAHAANATELARVNNQVITLEEFNKQYQESLKFFPAGAAPSKKAMLDEMIKRDLGVQEAKKEGLDRDPIVMDRINTVLFQSLVERKLAKTFENITISDEEAREFYDRNPEIRTSEIFVAVKPKAKPAEEQAARATIQKIYDEQIRPGKISFAEAAQRFSQDPSAQSGGDLGYQTKDRADPTYYAAAVALKTPGRVSGIIRSPYGYHIIKLTAIRPWDETDHSLVKRVLVEQRRTEAFVRYMDGLRARARVSIQSELLK
ncbi:MAG: peptidylprolyl isomerase [Oligoflexia bacterium]|nr:peptidylprolyl isomerase [Oligoflexia bacterium]